MPDVIVEMLVGTTLEKMASVDSSTAIEIAVQEVSVVKETPDPSIVEVYATLPDTHYKIGGSSFPTDPAILVWYDTQGEGA